MDLGGERPRRLLHIAPEPVLEAKFRTLRAVEYVSGDLMRPNVTHKVNICNMQFEDQYFDAAFCSHVLEHVPDDRAAMAEFARVLKPEGSVLFSFPQGYAPTAEAPTLADPKERIRRFGQIDHLRLYGPDVVSRFVDAGLSFKEYRPSNICTHAELRAFGFDTEVDLVAYICKPAQS
jgi:SAM-dependent methyltransferase